MKKKIIIAAIVLIVLITAFYFYKKNAAVTKTDEPAPPQIIPGTNISTENLVSSDEFPLKVGSKGENVTYLQKALKTLGANIIVDGDFGQQTYSAILLTIDTKSYPVTVKIFNSILEKANAYK